MIHMVTARIVSSNVRIVRVRLFLVNVAPAEEEREVGRHAESATA